MAFEIHFDGPKFLSSIAGMSFPKLPMGCTTCGTVAISIEESTRTLRLVDCDINCAAPPDDRLRCRKCGGLLEVL